MNIDELKSKLGEETAAVCIVGMGYVGIPLAKAFSKHIDVIGFDIDGKKLEMIKDDLHGVELTDRETEISKADFVIVCVPTPVRRTKEPDLSFVESASCMVGRNMKAGTVVVYESTVYPGVTEERCLPILEEESGMRCGEEFSIGYSPERVNPGDEKHDVDQITKIVAGKTLEVGEVLKELYSLVTDVYLADSIKVAEAAKVIENVQRDLNIALMNELSVIFSKMGIDTKAVLDAAATKWNFHRYNPGLVGGHCIPVDPYYLVYKAKEMDYHPQVILAGRSINDQMPKHVAWESIKAINRSGKGLKGSKVLIMGLTYKENVPDTRESPVKGLIKELKEFELDVYGYDPLLTDEEIENFGAKLSDLKDMRADCIIMTVAHDDFKELSIEDMKGISEDKSVLVDVRGIFDKEECVKAGMQYITL